MKYMFLISIVLVKKMIDLTFYVCYSESTCCAFEGT